MVCCENESSSGKIASNLASANVVHFPLKQQVHDRSQVVYSKQLIIVNGVE